MSLQSKLQDFGFTIDYQPACIIMTMMVLRENYCRSV